MYKHLILLFVLIFFGNAIFATIIEGKNQEYAGKTLIFKTYSDPVSKTEKQLFTIQFDNDGNYKTEVPIIKTTFAFCSFGIFRGMFFAEPQKPIELLFPPLREKSFAEEKNPYFEPVNFWFNIRNDEGLNHQISSFETQFSQLTNQYFNQLYFRQSHEIYDSVVYKLNLVFPKTANDIFEIHKKLKLKLLENEVFRIESSAASEIISSISSNLWNTPAFIDYLENTFTNRLSFDAKERNGTEIKKAVALADTEFLINHVKVKYKLSGEAVELALLKMLHDAFYSGEFPKNPILKILESDNLAKNSNPIIREINTNISEKLEFLLPGTEAPLICLYNINGYKKCSNESSDKFKYLVFADAETMVCQEHLKYLSKINELFQKNLEIILIMRKTDIIEMKIFMDKNQIPGTILVDETGKFIEKYKIKSFPTCILLNEKHEVIYDVAKAPLDGFQQQFGSFIKNELFERQRNQSR